MFEIGILIAVILLAYANGANDNFKGTATLWGSGTLTYEKALRLATEVPSFKRAFRYCPLALS